MSRFRLALAAIGATCALSMMTACNSASSSGGGTSAQVTGDPASVSGDITVLTNRTDLEQDGTLKKYAAEFNKTYPKVSVKFQAITDYEGEVKIRMNTENYGDVLLIPNAISQQDYPKYFADLGTGDDLGKKYQFLSSGTVKGKVYGIAQNGNANGFVYNKAIWKKAGITTAPTTPAEFLTALTAIKTKTGAIPLYTNYKDGWPLSGWEGAVGSATCDPDAVNKLADTDAPWTKGSDLFTVDTLLFDAVHQQLTEPDPTTTNWENSKTLLGSAQVGTMWLASWAISQMRDAATKAGGNPDDIGLMPFPVQVDGKFCSVSGADYKQAVNVHSDHKGAARAWLDWFTDKSGYAASQGSLSTLEADPPPDTLADYTALGVKYIELSPAPADQVGLVNKIDNAAEVGLNSPDYRRNLVDVARGAASGDLSALFADLNKKWAAGVQAAGG